MDYVTFLQFEHRHCLDRFLPKHIDTGDLVNVTPPTILAGTLKGFFYQGLKMRMRFRCSPQIIFAFYFVI